ncbi:hypothetical protein D3C85_1648380 [compost metagenome]
MQYSRNCWQFQCTSNTVASDFEKAAKLLSAVGGRGVQIDAGRSRILFKTSVGFVFVQILCVGSNGFDLVVFINAVQTTTSISQERAH